MHSTNNSAASRLPPDPAEAAQTLPIPSPPAPYLSLASVTSEEFLGNPRYLLRTLYSAALPGSRTITIYLPAAYLAQPERSFPVFYLHDGQNLFDGDTSYLPRHTWRAHSTADRLTESGSIEPVILVGIANAGFERMAEYTPTADPRLGGGQGSLYGTLLIEELKPLIDSEFRTSPSAANTALGGSSLGGLISLFLALEHRSIFGKIAVISPSLWWDGRSILRLVRQAIPEPPLSIWLDMGTAEGARHLHDTDVLFSLLVQRGWQEGQDLFYQRALGAAHHEDAWADRFGDVLSFLFPADRPLLSFA